MKGLMGATLLAELIALLFMIAAGYFLGGTIIWFRGSTFGGKLGPDYTLQLEPGFIPVRHQDMLMAALETWPVGQEESVMNLLELAAMQNNTIVTKPDGMTIEITGAIRDVLRTWSGEEPYLMRLVKPGGDLYIVWSSEDTAKFKAGVKLLQIQKASVYIFTPAGSCKSGCELQLLVR